MSGLHPNRIRNRVMGAALLCVAGGFASFPLYMKHATPENLTQKKGALSGNSMMRGAYYNAGSKDVGADPDWDMTKGTYNGKGGGGGASFQPSAEEILKARAALQERLKEKGLSHVQVKQRSVGSDTDLPPLAPIDDKQR